YASEKITLAAAFTSRQIGELCLIGRDTLQQSLEIFGVLFLVGQNLFHDAPARRIVIAQITDDLAVGINSDPFRNQIFTNHIQERIALHVLRMTAHLQAFGAEIGLTIELRDSL